MPPIADNVIDIAATDSATPIDGRYLLITFDPGTGPNPTPESIPVMQSIDDVVRFIAENISAPELDRLVESFALDGTTATIPSGRFGENTIGRSVLNFETVSDADLTARLTDYALADSISGYILVGVKSPALAGSTDKWDATDVAIDTSSFTGAARNNDTVQKLAAAFNTLVASAGAVWVAPDSQQAFDAIKDRIVAGSNITITPDDAADTLTIASTASGGGQTSDADIDARIAPFARANNPSGTIADDRIPAGIARDSEVENFATVGDSTDVPDSKIPASITRDSEVEDFAKTGNSAQVPDAKIPSAIARDSEVPDNLTDLDDTPGSLGTAGQLLAVDSAGTSTEFIDPPSGGGTATDLTTTASKNSIKDAVGEMLTGNKEDGIDVSFKSTDRTIDFEVDAQRGASFPDRPYDGQQFILTTASSVSGDRYIQSDQFSGDTIQKRFPLVDDETRTAESNTVEWIRAFSAEYSGTAPDNTLNNKVFLQVKGDLSSNRPTKLRFHSTGDINDAPLEYDISATAFPSFNTYYEVGDRSGADSGVLTFAELADSEDRHYFNIEFADGTLLYPDIPLGVGEYYYDNASHSWKVEDVNPTASQISVDTSNLGANVPRSADTVQKVVDAVDNLDIVARVGSQNFSNQTGPGATITSSNTSLRGTFIDDFRVGTAAASEFVLTGKSGTISVEATITLSNESDEAQIGFGDSSDRHDSITVYGFARVGTILERDAYGPTADNGERIIHETVTNLAGSNLTDIDLWLTRVTSGANQILRLYMDVDGIAGSFSFSVGTHVKMDFIPHDTASAGGGTATPPAVVENVPSAAVVITTPSTQGHATNTAPRWSPWTTLMETATATQATTMVAMGYVHAEETGTAPPGGGQRMFIESEWVRVAANGTETVVGGALDFYIRHFDNGSAQLGGEMSIVSQLAVGERMRVKVRARRQNNLNDSVGTIQATYTVATNHIFSTMLGGGGGSTAAGSTTSIGTLLATSNNRPTTAVNGSREAIARYYSTGMRFSVNSGITQVSTGGSVITVDPTGTTSWYSNKVIGYWSILKSGTTGIGSYISPVRKQSFLLHRL